MIIPNKTLNRWKTKMEHGDFEKIAEAAGVHYTTVSRAFKSKRCKVELHNKIEKFYIERENQIIA